MKKLLCLLLAALMRLSLVACGETAEDPTVDETKGEIATEVETDDPESYVRAYLKGRAENIHTDRFADGKVTVYASCDGLNQKFIFTPF